MKLRLNSANRNFLEEFEPDITFINDAVILGTSVSFSKDFKEYLKSLTPKQLQAELDDINDEVKEAKRDIGSFLKEYGYTIDELKENGLRVRSGSTPNYTAPSDPKQIPDFVENELKGSQHVITIPAGTHAKILEVDNYETKLKIKDIEISNTFTYSTNSGEYLVEATAIDPEKEKVFGSLGINTPREDSTVELYGFYISDLYQIVGIFSEGDRDKNDAFEDLKYMSKEQILTMVKRFCSRYGQWDPDSKFDMYNYELNKENLRQIIEKTK